MGAAYGPVGLTVLGGRDAAASVFVLFRDGELLGAGGSIFLFRALTAFWLIWRAFPMGLMGEGRWVGADRQVATQLSVCSVIVT